MFQKRGGREQWENTIFPRSSQKWGLGALFKKIFTQICGVKKGEGIFLGAGSVREVVKGGFYRNFQGAQQNTRGGGFSGEIYRGLGGTGNPGTQMG